MVNDKFKQILMLKTYFEFNITLISGVDINIRGYMILQNIASPLETDFFKVLSLQFKKIGNRK